MHADATHDVPHDVPHDVATGSHEPARPTRRRALVLGGLAAGAAVAGPGLVAGASAATGPAPALLRVGEGFGPAPYNLLRDGSFKLWQFGTTRPVPASATAGVRVCGLWRGVAHTPPGATAQQSAVASRLDPVLGGVRFRITNPGVFYVRQYLFGSIAAFAGHTYTLTADVDLEGLSLHPGAPRDAGVRFDVYVQARYNKNVSQRVLVADTSEVQLPTGRRIVTATFTVPYLNPSAFPVDEWQSLELALRPMLLPGVAGAVISVRKAVMVEGILPFSSAVEDPAAELSALRRYYETGAAPRAAGATRAVRFQRRKWKPGGAARLTVRDHTGTAGKVSVIGPLGVLVPGVTPLISSPSLYLDGFTVAVPGLRTGTTFSWAYDGF